MPRARPIGGGVTGDTATRIRADAIRDTFEQATLQEGLTPTFWFEPTGRGRAYSVSIRFTGSRVAVVGKPQPGDHFDQVETIDDIVPGSGPISLTSQIRRINPGEWIVRAKPITRTGKHGPAR